MTLRFFPLCSSIVLSLFPSSLFSFSLFFVLFCFSILVYIFQVSLPQYLLIHCCPFIFKIKVLEFWLEANLYLRVATWRRFLLMESIGLFSYTVFSLGREISEVLPGSYKAKCQFSQSWAGWVKGTKWFS